MGWKSCNEGLLLSEGEREGREEGRKGGRKEGKKGGREEGKKGGREGEIGRAHV